MSPDGGRCAFITCARRIHRQKPIQKFQEIAGIPAILQEKDKKMIDLVMDILSKMGVLPAVQFIAVGVAAIYIYMYFTNRS